MQAPAPHAQTYNVVATTNVAALVLEYAQLATELAAAAQPAANAGFKKAIPTNVLQQKTNRKQALEPLIKHQLETDIDTIGKNYDRYKQGVETRRSMAKQRLDHAKAAVLAYRKTKTNANLETAVHDTASVAQDIQLLLETAQADGKNFGHSWFDYRAYNPQFHAPTLPHAVVDDFLNSRTAMINDSKLVTARMKKFEELVVQARALNKMSATLHAGGQQDANAAFAKSTALANKMDTEVQTILNGGGSFKHSWHTTQTKYTSLHSDAADAHKDKEADLKVAEDRYADAVAAGKVLKAKIKSTQVVLGSEVRSFTKPERELGGVKTQIKHAQEEFAQTAPILKLLAAAEAQGLKDITLMRKRCVH